MMTIKHVENGKESIVSVDTVDFDAKTGVLTGHLPAVNGKAGGSVIFSSGHAFVMNDQGKTVGAYNMRVSTKEE